MEKRDMREKDTEGVKRKNYSQQERTSVWERENGKNRFAKCNVLWCNSKLDGYSSSWHLGHNIPLTNLKKKEDDVLTNLFPICIDCNLGMGNEFTITKWSQIINLMTKEINCCEGKSILRLLKKKAIGNFVWDTVYGEKYSVTCSLCSDEIERFNKSWEWYPKEIIQNFGIYQQFKKLDSTISVLPTVYCINNLEIICSKCNQKWEDFTKVLAPFVQERYTIHSDSSSNLVSMVDILNPNCQDITSIISDFKGFISRCGKKFVSQLSESKERTFGISEMLNEVTPLFQNSVENNIPPWDVASSIIYLLQDFNKIDLASAFEIQNGFQAMLRDLEESVNSI